MRVQNCFFPKVIKNPYTGNQITCRCGKCAACRNERASHWVQRLDMESTCHKYTLFCTITYDDFNVPQIVRMRYDDYPKAAYIDSDSGQLFELSEIRETFTDNDKKYVSDSKVLNVLSKSDFQKFIKRLRYYFHECDKAQLRYYLCGEYGPRTYRPHGHMLLFFDSDKCRQNIELLLSKAWTFGNIYDPHLVHGTASEYVASYINSFASLPKVYLHKQLKPFTLFSKSPSIGSLYPTIKDEQKLIDSGLNEFRRFDKASNQFKDVPFWKSFEARLYPRLQRFSSLSHVDRMSLYRQMARINQDFATTNSKVDYLEQKFVKSESFFSNYLWTISHKRVIKYHFVRYHSIEDAGFKDFPFLPTGLYIPSDMDAIKVPAYDYVRGSLERFVRTFNLIQRNAQKYGLSLSDYDLKIEKYYENRNLKRLQKDFDYQSEYFRTNPKWHYIYFDKSFYDKVTKSDFNSFSLPTKLTLKELFDGNVPLKDYRVSNTAISYKVVDIPDIEKLDDFRSMVVLHTKISKDLTKTKENNDYALLHKDKFSNIINYQNL